MQTFSLKANIVIVYNGRRLRLDKRLMNGQLLFKDEFGEPVILAEPDFYSGYEKKELALDPEQPFVESVPLVRNAPPDLTCFTASPNIIDLLC